MRILAVVLGSLLSAFGAVVALLFYDRYWQWRQCFNDQGRCFDPQTGDVYLEQSGLVYGGLAALCLIGGLAMIVGALRRPGRHIY